MEELFQEGQLSLLIAPSIDPLHPLGSTKRLNRWPAFIELTSFRKFIRALKRSWHRLGHLSDLQGPINQLSETLI
jgi:hypothetical protein